VPNVPGVLAVWIAAGFSRCSDRWSARNFPPLSANRGRLRVSEGNPVAGVPFCGMGHVLERALRDHRGLFGHPGALCGVLRPAGRRWRPRGGYPPAYLDACRSGSSAVEVSIDEDGNPRIYYPGDYNIAVPGHRDIDYREQVLIETGVDTQVLTLTTRHARGGARHRRPLRRLVNDCFAAWCKASADASPPWPPCR